MLYVAACAAEICSLVSTFFEYSTPFEGSTALSFVFSFARLLGSVNSVQKARLDFSGKILPS
jgi:hypothetical protein